MPSSNNVRKVTSENYPTDAGREGELIFRLVYQQAGCKKPFSRLWLSSMEENAIREGFAHLKPSTEYDALYNAARCRERADWMVGINASRLFSCLYNQPLAVGRVMTPVLAMTVVREAAIAAFTPEKFYTVALTLADGGTASSKRFAQKADAELLLSKCRKEGRVTVQKMERKEKSESPPQLYDLTALQRDANRLLGFTAQQTLDYAHIPTEAEQIESIDQAESEKSPSAFSLSQAEIENALRRGSNFENSKLRIWKIYQLQPDRKLRAKALANEYAPYGPGGSSHTYLDGSSGWLDHDSKGLTFEHGIRAPWKIYCIRSAYYIYKSYGASLYREMLSVLVDAWGGDSDSFLSGILHGMARFLALYQGEYSRERLILRLRTVHPKTITRLAQNDTGNVADRHMKQILSIYNGAGRTHNLPCKR